jgi:hypothetical protein
LGTSSYRFNNIYGHAVDLSGSLTAASYIRANYGIQDDSGSYGTSGQALKSGGTGVVNWANTVNKYERGVVWKSVQSNVSYSGDVCTITHNLGKTCVTVSIIDVAGSQSNAGANGLVDLDYICEVKTIDTTSISFEFTGNTQPSYGNTFKVSVIG